MQPHHRLQLTGTRRLTLIALLAALCTVTNYLFLPLENVKPMDFIVFIAGYLAGPFAGAVTGILGWTLYGTINPHGFNLNVWAATSLAETLYGVAGGVIGRRFQLETQNRSRDAFLLGVLAAGVTFAYDVLTTLVAIFTFGFPLFLSFILAIPWFVAHEAGNLLIFTFCAFPVIRPLTNLMRRKS